MYTSNFARIKQFPNHLRSVAICQGVPWWYKRDRELLLAPSREMLSMSPVDYDRLFDEQLAALDPAEVAADLGDNAVLLCWESPNIRCHRRRVAEWLEKNLGIVITEYGFNRSGVLLYHDMPAKSAKQKATVAKRRSSKQDAQLFD